MNPEQFFPGKQSDEKILCWVHRHWLFLLPDILIGSLLTIIPIGLIIGANALGADLSTYPTRPAIVIIGSVYYLGLVTWFFIRWIDFYLDLAIVTDQKVVDIDQFGLFRRNVAELKHDVVQDVTTNKAGILQTFFDFGDVVIQTAGEQENFTFRTIPHPDEVARKITEVGHDKEAEEKGATEAVTEAAEHMKEVAEKLDETVSEPQAPGSPPPANPQPPASPGPSDGPSVNSEKPSGAAPVPAGTPDPQPNTQVDGPSNPQAPESPNPEPNPQQQQQQQQPPSQPPADSPPSDLPREYER